MTPIPKKCPKKHWLAAFVLFAAGINFAIANFAMTNSAMADDFSLPVKTYPFGVLNQRSVSLTVEYWNPILRYLSEKTGLPLSLRIARTANETTDLAVKGELAFVYTNHLFTPERDKLGYTVLARQEGEAIRGQIVVGKNAPIDSLRALHDQPVAYANPYSFAGYFVPMDKLLREEINVKPIFAGNQEAAMGRLRAGQVTAAGANSKVMADFALRENFPYKVLWSSEPYYDLAVMAHPSVPKNIRDKIRDALILMKADPEGYAILTIAARTLELSSPRGFAPATDANYDNYRVFFRNIRVPFENQ